MEGNNTFQQQSRNNKYLINENLTLDDLKTYLRLRFLSYREAGFIAGISENRVRQFLIGYNLPKSADLISQIAESWGINPLKLLMLFENVDHKGRKKIKEEVSVSETSSDTLNISENKVEEDEDGK